LIIYPGRLTTLVAPDLFPGLREPFWVDEIFPEMVEAFVWITFSQLVQMFHFFGDVDHKADPAYCCPFPKYLKLSNLRSFAL
jgi:hypothetical protein